MRPPRTFPEALRRLDHETLSRLIELRPDLADPLPANLTELASRATTSTSVQRAMERLNSAQLLVLQAIAADGTSSREQLAELTGQPQAWLDARVDELRQRALVWGSDEWHLVREAHLALGPWPGGLAPAAATDQHRDHQRLTLDQLGDAELSVLHRLAWGPPTGAVQQADRPVELTTAKTPIERLLARGLLRAQDSDTVILPRDVALAVRGGFARPEFSRDPLPPPSPEPIPAARSRRVDLAAQGAAYAAIQEVDALIDEVERMAPQLLRAGGLSAADQAQLARRMGTAPTTLGRTFALAEELGLIRTTGQRLEVTNGYDRWLALPGIERWTTLVGAWRNLPRWPERDPRPLQHEPNPLHGRAPEVRALALRELTRYPIGATVDWSAITAAVEWERPAWQNLQLDMTLGELAAGVDWLGLTALGGRSRLADIAEGGPVPDDLDFPAPVRSLILQADLTAVAAGPVHHDVLGVLRLLADPESRGTASVYRFTPASIRRGLDRGWSADAIGDWLTEHSETGVPQPLQYLVADAARRHGSIRVGSVRSWLRMDDPAQATMITSHPQAMEYGIRQVAPGVILAAAEAADLVDWLHQLGLSPAAESLSGQTLIAPAPPRPAWHPERTSPPPDPASVATRLLANEQTARAGSDTTDLTKKLTRAADSGGRIDVAWVDASGTQVRRTGVAVQLSAGRVRLKTDPADEELWLPLARIRTVEVVVSGGRSS